MAEEPPQAEVKKKKKEKEPWPDHPIKGKAGSFYLPYPVFCLRTDGTTIVTGGGKGGAEYGCENVLEAHTWDAENGTLLTAAREITDKRLPTSVRNTGDLWAVAMNPPAAMEIYRIVEKDGKLKFEFCLEQSTEDEGKDKELNVVELDGAADHAATGGMDGVLRIWRIVGLQSATLAASMKHENDGKKLEVKDLSWAPSATQVVTLAHDKKARIWDVKERTVLATLQVSNPTPTAREPMLDLRVCRWFAPQEEDPPKLLVGASGIRGPAVLSVWETHTKGGPRNVRQVTVEKTSLTKLALNDDHSEVVVGFASGSKKRISTETWTQDGFAMVHDLPPSGVGFVGDVAVSVGPDFVLHLMEARKGSRLACLIPFFCVVMMLFFLIRLSLALSPMAAPSYQTAGIGGRAPGRPEF